MVIKISGIHKYPTVSFRVSPELKRLIEAKIKASGMQKKDYYIRSCIYNHVCVVGKKENIYVLVEELKSMQEKIKELALLVNEKDLDNVKNEELVTIKKEYIAMLSAIIWLLDGAKYLWMGDE